MASEVEKYMKIVEQIEKQFRHHGIWVNPEIMPPQVRAHDDWDNDMKMAATVLNRIFMVRSLPTVSRLFGPVRESSCDEFETDCSSLTERTECVKRNLRRLVADLDILPQFDKSMIVFD